MKKVLENNFFRDVVARPISAALAIGYSYGDMNLKYILAAYLSTLIGEHIPEFLETVYSMGETFVKRYRK
ncbi:MAG: hypothetical protein QXJ06_00265 [Candidatus Aenigmatarchaeota archaeon]